MNRLPCAVVLVLGLVLVVSIGSAQKNLTIPQIQQVPIDSLLLMEASQSGARVALDDSPRNNDTVRVTGVVLVKPRILTYTLARYNIFIQDTTTGAVWAGLNVLTNDTSDQAQTTGITALDSGDVVTVVGKVTEFGSQPNSLTEIFIWNVGFFESPQPVEVGVTIPRPAPVELKVDSFSVGTAPRISVGEKYEGMYVVIRNVTVTSVDLSSGRFRFADASGNEMLMYDGSGYYTSRGHKITGSRYTPPPVGTKLAYIRGVILPQARSGTAGEYTIMPLYPGPGQLPGSTYPGDVVIDKFAPSITDIKRSPGVPKSTDSVKITYKATELNVGAMIDSTAVYFKVGSGSFIRNKVSLAQGDSLYRFTIPRQPNDSLVSYYVVAYSNLGSSGASPDPTVPLFYRIRDQGLTIYDVQWTPNVNGISGFVGDTVTVSGIITADTSDIKETGASSRPLLRFASKSGEWNAITIYGTTADVGIDTLMRGDSIQVTVVVRERFSRTELQVLSRTFVQRGVTVPAASVISISGSGSASYELSNPPVDGNTTFEKWEGVLVQVNNAYVVLMNADNPTNVGPSNHFGEFFISAAQLGTSSARFGLRVNDNGTNRFYVDTSAFYTAKPANAILISIGPFGTKISSLKGIFDYSFSFYKLEPRKDDDFGTITSVYEVVGALPTGFELSQNYPNPFNPITTVQYSIPVSGKVSLNVYNILGQHVATLVNEEMKAGTYHVEFDAKRLASGVYFYHLKMDHFTDVKKMVLLK